MGWSVATARAALATLEEHAVRSVEDPVATPVELARLRQHTTIGFSTHNPDLFPVVTRGVPDAIVINLTVLGGIARTVAFINACEHLGVEVWFYSPDTGVGNAAYRQVAAAMEWLGEPHQTLLRWHADDVVVDPLVPEAGTISASDAPGLGVALDAAALRRCHEAYRTNGPYDQYCHPDRVGYGPRRIANNRYAP
jgi:glucarate dehydratase